MVQKELKDALDEILDSVKSKLETAITEGKLDAVSIIRGDRARVEKAMPQVWLFGEIAEPNYTRRSLHETLEYTIILTPVVRSNLPEEGYALATQLAAQARSASIKNHTLDREYVQDVRGGRFEPSAPWHRDGNTYSATAAIVVVFTILEI